MIKLLCCAGVFAVTPFVMSLQPANDNQAVIQKWVELWRGGDADIATEILAEDMVRFHPRDELIRDRRSMVGLVRHIRTAFPDFAVEVGGMEIDARGGHLEWTVTGTHTGPGEGPPTGKQVRIQGSDVFVIEGGKITQNWGGWDQNEFYAQLGAPRTPPRPHTNLQTMLLWPNELCSKGNYDVLEQALTEDHVLDENGTQFEGREGMRRHTMTVRDAFEGFHVEVLDAHCDGDRGSARWIATGKHTGEFFGIPATGRDIRVHGLMLTQFAGSQLKHSFLSWDTASLLRQLGVAGKSAAPADASTSGK